MLTCRCSYGYSFSLSFYFIIYLPHLLLFVLSLFDHHCPSLQTMGFGIYDAVSDTYPESYPQRASLYLKLSLCSFPGLSEHSLGDLVLCHCNSLFLMFLMCIPRHPGGLFIFLFSTFGLLLLPSPLPHQAVLLDLNTALQV